MDCYDRLDRHRQHKGVNDVEMPFADTAATHATQSTTTNRYFWVDCCVGGGHDRPTFVSSFCYWPEKFMALW